MSDRATSARPRSPCDSTFHPATASVAQREKHTPAWLTALITLLVLALIGGLGYLGYRWMQNRTPQTVTVEVPAVIGYSESAARSTLHNAKLNPVVTYKDDSSAQQESVTEENPSAGTRVPEQSDVKITVTRVPNKLTIPSLKGKTEKEARTALANAGFKDGNISTQEATADTPDVPKGSVTDVTPAEGSTGNADTKVVLTLSNGKVTVPDLRGATRAEAEQRLRAKGLNAEVSEEESPNTAGSVLRQDPGANSKVDAGSTVSVVVAKAPTPTPTPSPTPVQTPTVTPTATATKPTATNPVTSPTAVKS